MDLKLQKACISFCDSWRQFNDWNPIIVLNIVYITVWEYKTSNTICVQNGSVYLIQRTKEIHVVRALKKNQVVLRLDHKNSDLLQDVI